ncbi:hypothetical protein EXIGLDRAFT_758467 [Exidia glandulosa HHB12029]|uniref:CDC14-domain-containing protein n=1 Tax=Exidia glandulosa HHB12029 TaxID=1314781 RepID=A0A165QWM7_EXIGL|nr:hypothetical protein EXIGLDRAFT_758467 [Exidia glandulosa HHB12029]
MDSRRQISTALDDISSISASHNRRQRALDKLERVVAETCAALDGADPSRLSTFLELQDAFDCNIASRLLPFIAQALPVLRAQAVDEGDGASDEDYGLYCCVAQSMSLLQGLALLHSATKSFLSKKWVIEVFLALLACPQLRPSTPVPASPTKSPTKSSASSRDAPPPLAIAVVDTLLCVLVDAPLAIRAFEEVNGLEVIVKTLKRAGVPRDIRMKCLEFLYWYLLPEDAPPTRSASGPAPSAPSSPTKRTATNALQANASWPSANPIPPPVPPMPDCPGTPPRSPTKSSRTGLLRRDLDFVPTTPKRPTIARLGVGTPRGGATRTTGTDSPLASPTKRRMLAPSGATDRSSRAPSRDSSFASENVFLQGPAPTRLFASKAAVTTPKVIKSTEEKKALLGTLLGNVDVLVEGVCKAGVWGLG